MSPSEMVTITADKLLLAEQQPCFEGTIICCVINKSNGKNIPNKYISV